MRVSSQRTRSRSDKNVAVLGLHRTQTKDRRFYTVLLRRIPVRGCVLSASRKEIKMCPQGQERGRNGRRKQRQGYSGRWSGT